MLLSELSALLGFGVSLFEVVKLLLIKKNFKPLIRIFRLLFFIYLYFGSLKIMYLRFNSKSVAVIDLKLILNFE